MGNYASVDYCNMDNGRGIRVAVWLQGCPHRCRSCFNPKTWDKDQGHKVTKQFYNDIEQALSQPHIQGISILGGEPLARYNMIVTLELSSLAKKFNKDVWVWTGYDWHEISDLMQDVDVLIDGKYIDELADKSLKWRGSSNQKVINVQKSLAANTIILDEDN